MYMCDPPRIYPSLSQNIRPFSTNVYVRHSQNLPLPLNIYTPFQQMYMCDPPRIYPLPFHQLYATLSESTPPSQNIPPFSTNVYVRPSQNLRLPLSIYPFFNNYVQSFQNLPLPPRIHPPFSTTIILCDPSRIDPSLLPGYTPPFSTTIILCDPPRVYPSLSEYTPLCNKCICVTLPGSTPPSQNIPPLFNNYMRPSQTLPLPPKYTPFQQMYMCDP